MLWLQWWLPWMFCFEAAWSIYAPGTLMNFLINSTFRGLALAEGGWASLGWCAMFSTDDWSSTFWSLSGWCVLCSRCSRFLLALRRILSLTCRLLQFSLGCSTCRIKPNWQHRVGCRHECIIFILSLSSTDITLHSRWAPFMLRSSVLALWCVTSLCASFS